MSDLLKDRPVQTICFLFKILRATYVLPSSYLVRGKPTPYLPLIFSRPSIAAFLNRSSLNQLTLIDPYQIDPHIYQ